MKLSFSIKGWSDHSWSEFCDLALEMEFQGIELHNIHGTDFTAKGSPFHAHAAAATIRGLQEKKLSIPCIDSICDIADDSSFDYNCSEIAAWREKKAGEEANARYNEMLDQGLDWEL